jgi:heptosyltransferase-1
MQLLPFRSSRGRTPASGEVSAVLIVRLSAIGDLLFCTPLVSALRRTYPRARLVWLVQAEYAGMLATHPDLDEVVPCPLTRWRADWRGPRRGLVLREVRDLVHSLRRRRFDLALDLQGLLKSGLLVWLSGARRRVGLGSREGSGLLMHRVLKPLPESERIGSEYLFLAASLGLRVEHFEMSLPGGDADAAAAEALIDSHGLGGGFVAACPFTTRPQKHWLDERWSELARRVQDEFGLRTAVLGGPGDRDRGRALSVAADSAAVNLAGDTSLQVAARVIGRSRGVVAVDTGLGHMGIAAARPTLLLFGSTRPYTDAGRDDARVLYQALDCSPCRRRPTCDGRFDCMRDISVDAVMRALRALPGFL